MMGGGAGAYALHWSRGAARCVRSHIPGALSILKGAVPDRARGLGHMAPTYSRREPGIAAPTAIAAPRVHCAPTRGSAHGRSDVRDSGCRIAHVGYAASLTITRTDAAVSSR